MALLAGAVGMAVLLQAFLGADPAGGPGSIEVADPAPRPAAAAAARGPRPFTWPVGEPGTMSFASAEGLPLHLPARRVVGVTYHEASYPEALDLSPAGWCHRNANRPKYRCGPLTPGPKYVVMHSRGRGQSAVSAADIALRVGEPVLAPVSGIVWRVELYRLYGAYRDRRIVLIPFDRPHTYVTVLHLTDVRVRRGWPVTAGTTRLGSARVLPFRSQVNDYVGAGVPHVHIEVKRFGSTGLQAASAGERRSRSG